MTVTILEGCIACGLCEGTCPEVFCIGAQGTAEVAAQPTPSQEAAVQDAAAACPVNVIEVSL
ncbi:MAG: ferredoxin [Pygmaiobacter sp.]